MYVTQTQTFLPNEINTTIECSKLERKYVKSKKKGKKEKKIDRYNFQTEKKDTCMKYKIW